MMSPKRRKSTSVRQAVRQEKPFDSVNEEALMALLLTSHVVRHPIQELLARDGDLTYQQYNVLRILRGAGRQGLPTLEIAERMIERTPGITRLIDRLEKKGLVTRHRESSDRRQVMCTINKKALALLRRLDPPIRILDVKLMSALNKSELRELIRMLDRIRNSLTK